MKIHLIDGTYELFRSFYGPPPRKAPDGREVGATIGLLRSLIAYWVGYDLTGQLSNAGAGSIEWTADLIDSESRETDIWYTQSLQFTAVGDSVSIWFAGSQREGDFPFRISLDEVGLEKINP